jgi:DNA-binding transcriptional ArsR family regulator
METQMTYQSNKKLAKFEKVFKAFSCEKRLAILLLLRKEKRLPVWYISKKLGIPFRTVSKHLHVLYAIDILAREQDNVEVYYTISIGQSHLINYIINKL